MSQRDDRIAELRARLASLDRERSAAEAELACLDSMPELPAPPLPRMPRSEGSEVDHQSPIINKISLFRRLFLGRSDVFPVRWENIKDARSGYAPACHNEWRRICDKPRIKCSVCPHQAFIAVSDEVIERHLRGTSSTGAAFVAGVYPILANDTCWFLAADFDRGDWHNDAKAYVETCRLDGVQAAMERSRSGKGAHAWIFFSEPIPASLARRLGSYFVTATMERVPDIGFHSYDRFFPNQDCVPSGGFGNLIALPMQGLARKNGNSLFVDDAFSPHPDQWAYLSGIERTTRNAVEAIVERASAAGRIFAVRLPVEDSDEEPWLFPPSRRRPLPDISALLPKSVRVVLADQIYVPRAEMPPALVTRLIRLAAFQNPEFYMAQALRLSTHGKPRIIACAELTKEFVGLPRGRLDATRDLLHSLGIEIEIADERNNGRAIKADFVGTLRREQQDAFERLRSHDTGVLAATTAFGKTVLAARMIAERRTNTLVVVHRQQLKDQWTERLSAFLDIPRDAIGTIGGGKRRPTGIVDVALIQSLVRNREVDDIVGDYGHLIVDECHHLSAVSFELVARRTKARFVLGLSATVVRKDGRHPIIFMQCGPVRHRVDAKSQAAKRPFRHRVLVRETQFSSLVAPGANAPRIHEVYAALARDEARNSLIFDDVLSALEAKRSPVVITERSDHLMMLAKRFEHFAKNVLIFKGGQGERQRRALVERLAAIPDHEERLLLATGRYLGEGFDDSRLDTLFLTMPISWKGTLAQYAGRLHRAHDGKTEVLIYDYVDRLVPVLAKMAGRRRGGYASLGYTVDEVSVPPVPSRIWLEIDWRGSPAS